MTLLLQKVDAMIYEGGWLLCLRIGDKIGLVCLAGPSKSFENINFANAFGRAVPALKERFVVNWYCHPTSRKRVFQPFSADTGGNKSLLICSVRRRRDIGKASRNGVTPFLGCLQTSTLAKAKTPNPIVKRDSCPLLLAE